MAAYLPVVQDLVEVIEPFRSPQNKIVPHGSAPRLMPSSWWLVAYADAMGEFLNTPESQTEGSEKSFYDSPTYGTHEYLRPNGGWKTWAVPARSHSLTSTPFAE